MSRCKRFCYDFVYTGWQQIDNYLTNSIENKKLSVMYLFLNTLFSLI